LKTQQIILADQRKLGFTEYGTETGYPIIYCHGSQSSRLEMHYDIGFATKHDLRIIAIDRPGHGISDFNPKGTILSFANDVKQLTHILNILRFSVIGMSAGAPFAMGLAATYPDAIQNLGIVSGFAPYTTESKQKLSKEVRVMLKLAKSFPFLLRLLLKVQSSQLKRNPQKTLANFLKIMSEPDQEVLKNAAVMKVIEDMFVESFKLGSQGVAYEISEILVQNWGFELKEIKIPTHIWQGDLDNNVPKEWAEILNREIGNSKLIRYPTEGHLLIFEHAESIFSTMKE